MSESIARAEESAILSLRMNALESLADGIWISDLEGEILYRNPAAAIMENMYWSRDGHVCTMEDAVFTSGVLSRLRTNGRESGEYHLCGDITVDKGKQLYTVGMQMQVLTGADGQEGLSFHARDVTREWSREQDLHDRHIELEQVYARVKQTQSQLLQSEKMASIGQLAAGVAHEINNPIGYVHSNLSTLQSYAHELLSLLAAYETLSQKLPHDCMPLLAPIQELKACADYNYLQQDLPQLIEESREGIERVKKIVMDLRDFSHAGELENEHWAITDLHRGLQSTLNIVWNELKYKVEVRKDFGDLPAIECLPSQLNQVFLNLLVNAGHAITDHGVITIATRRIENEVCISIADSGQGIAPANLARIFDPFFTTKAIGKGTGLGLSLSYGIVQKHHGRIEVQSAVGKGTTFKVYLPVRQASSMTGILDASSNLEG